ncbi:hypothetical protein GCM10010260_16900 [Streptomyces filipinensis]|uniref:Transmembrane protein n=1 Tax=Streptomyces filipinensis TaxID=66887 RepID=A0A918M929_9ACTN|nr:hypothetical protein [Streptomyces filipinensis]GGU84462.1 hypothetical protein GCM10010260_16900 [Streptomyces filipinensis]
MPDHDPPAAWPPRMSDAEATAEARRIIADAYGAVPQMPTAYRDRTPLPAYGSTPPVLQPDRRIVPAWAAGMAVAGIGTGAAFVGVGCGIWLACQGFAAVTLTSVLFVTLPIAAVAALAAAIGSAVRSVKATRTETHHYYSGPVRQETNTITAPAYGLIARSRNELHR